MLRRIFDVKQTNNNRKTTRIMKKKTIIKQDFKGCFTVLNVDGNVIFVKFYIVPLINELFYDLLKVFIVFLLVILILIRL